MKRSTDVITYGDKPTPITFGDDGNQFYISNEVMRWY